MKRQIETEDNLDEIVESAKDDVVEEFKREDLSVADFRDVWEMVNKIDYNGSFHEIIDSSTPIYNKEIDDLYYLYGNEAEEAFRDEGIGSSDDFDNYRQVALYCLINRRVLDELDDWFAEEAERIEEERESATEEEEEEEETPSLPNSFSVGPGGRGGRSFSPA